MHLPTSSPRSEPLPTAYAPAERAASEELAAQAAALRQHPLIDALLEAQPGLAFILNRHRQIVYANRATLAALGLPHAALLGARPGEAVGCVHAQAAPGGCGTAEACCTCGAVNAILGCRQRHVAQDNECQILIPTADGPVTLELRVRATPLTLAGEPYVVLAGLDIAAQNRRAALERTFFHDALNLAGALLASTRALCEGDRAAARDDAQRPHLLAQLLTEEIRAQRDLAAAESGDLRVRPVRASAGEILAQVAAAYECHPVAAGRTLRRVPPAPDVVVYVGAVLLLRVLGNLVKNALEAAPQGGTVTLACEPAGEDHVCFRVHDPGHMPRAVQLHLFHRSFSTKPGAGRGLGTFSAKLLTERYLGGTIVFTSARATGTEFRVTLPRGHAPAHVGAAGSRAPLAGPPLAGLRVLVADDDDSARCLLQRILELAGASVTVAADGQAALEAVALSTGAAPGSAFRPAGAANVRARAAAPFDVVVLDVEMPRQTGYEVAMRLRAQCFAGPVIALSGHDSATTGARCLAAGFNAFVEKPFDTQAILDLLSEVRPRTP